MMKKMSLLIEQIPNYCRIFFKKGTCYGALFSIKGTCQNFWGSTPTPPGRAGHGKGAGTWVRGRFLASILKNLTCRVIEVNRKKNTS